VTKHYGDAYQTAHFEVPGEMFALAMAAKRERNMGVVGSTKNILDFVVEKTEAALARNLPSGERLSFVLGTGTCCAFPKSRHTVCPYNADTFFFLS
jgi:quinolinate synthase